MRLLHARLRDGDVRLCARRRAGARSRSFTTRSPAISAAAPATGRSSRPAGRLRACPIRRALCRRLCAVSAERETIAAAIRLYFAPRSLAEIARSARTISRRHRVGGGTDLGLLASKERKHFPGHHSRPSMSPSCSASLRAMGWHRDRRRRDIYGSVAAYRQTLSRIRRDHPPHRLAADPQSRHHRGQYRQRLADRRHHSLPDRARRGGHALCDGGGRARCRSRISSPATARPRSRRTRSSRRSAFPSCRNRDSIRAYKLSKRFDQDISTVIAAFSLTLEDGGVQEFRAVFGGMAAKSRSAQRTSKKR